MNFIEAVKLIQNGKTVHRASFRGSGIQASLDKDEIGIVNYHVAACELHFTPDDILADDWVEGANY